MRTMKEQNKIDAVAEEGDYIDIRIQPSLVNGEYMLYVDVNGETILRIGGINHQRLSLKNG